MLGCRLAICAEAVVRDAATNAVSVFNIIEEISSQTFPRALPKLSCLFLLHRDANDDPLYNGLVRIIDNGVETTAIPLEIDFKDKLVNRNIVVLGGLPISGPGELRVSLLVEGVERASWSIPVKQVGGPQIEVEQG
jgi:hypothetical protein